MQKKTSTLDEAAHDKNGPRWQSTRVHEPMVADVLWLLIHLMCFAADKRQDNLLRLGLVRKV